MVSHMIVHVTLLSNIMCITIELSFKSGDEICVVGFKNVTSKWRPVSMKWSIIITIKITTVSLNHTQIIGVVF